MEQEKQQLAEVLEDKTIDIINWLEGAIKTSTDFASEQIPLFIQELLHYNFVMSLLWFSSGILGAIIICYYTRKFWKWMVDERCLPEWCPALIFCACGFGGCLIFASCNTDWIKIKLAPRVYLMEYVKDNLK